MSNAWMTCALLRIFNLFGPKNGSQKQKNTVFLHQCGTHSKDVSSLNNKKVKVKQSLYMPWRRLGGEEV
jgi:hypothetical protein